jgi:hypothetical protein
MDRMEIPERVVVMAGTVEIKEQAEQQEAVAVVEAE